jgi:hypothetical protein
MAYNTKGVRMKIRVLAASMVAAAAISSLAFAPATAQAAPAAEGTKCYAAKMITKEAVLFRDKPNLKAKAKYQINKGVKVPCVRDLIYSGPQFKKCGRTSNMWTKVRFKGFDGYVVGHCVRTA